ncbi:hypothetical protein DENSPDRAFT_879114 [Dentipellis sp. KUC8613]|nr:hypothetical protein DENSPDRAFT_879114 [Dentipellis sp. KUC8613]
MGDRLVADTKYADTLRDQIIPLAVGSLFYGIYTIIIVISTYFLLTKCVRSRENLLMMSATIVMYTVASVHWAVNVAFLYISFKSIYGPLPHSTIVSLDHMKAFRIYVSVVVYVFGDAIVSWRAWVLWRRQKWILIPPAVLSTIVIAMACVSGGAYGLNNDRPLLVMATGIIAFGGSLLTNIWATSLIAIKAWQYRQNIHIHLKEGTAMLRAERIFSLLVESGSLYCCLLIVFILGQFGPLPAMASYIMAICVIQISGIYPTIILVLVCLQKSHCDRQFTYDSSPPLYASQLRLSTIVDAGVVEPVTSVCDADQANLKDGDGTGDVDVDVHGVGRCR